MRHATGRTIIIDNLKRHRITARRRERIRQDLTRPNRLPGQRPAEPNHNTIRIRRTRPIKRARQQRTILNEPRNRSLICDLRDGYVLDLLAGCAVIIGDHELHRIGAGRRELVDELVAVADLDAVESCPPNVQVSWSHCALNSAVGATFGASEVVTETVVVF